MSEDCIKCLDDLRTVLVAQIKKVTAKNDISPTELDNMNKALCALETIDRIKNGELEPGGYSNDTYRFSGTMPRMSHDSRMSYDPRMSYGMPYDGRYSSTYGHHGYSGHSIADRMVDALERMYDEAGTDHERKLIDKYIRMLRDE